MARLQVVNICCAAAVLFVGVVLSFPTGAPESRCDNMTPGHSSNTAQTAGTLTGNYTVSCTTDDEKHLITGKRDPKTVLWEWLVAPHYLPLRAPCKTAWAHRLVPVDTNRALNDWGKHIVHSWASCNCFALKSCPFLLVWNGCPINLGVRTWYTILRLHLKYFFLSVGKPTT